MSGITTHVLDTSRGLPVANLRIELDRKSGAGWTPVGAGRTDENGRCHELLGAEPLATGTYRLVFHAGAYFQARQTEGFYSEIPIIFEVREVNAHYHVPLLISPFSYCTYRGS
jgi:5-hydroxyisourate hydrolase